MLREDIREWKEFKYYEWSDEKVFWLPEKLVTLLTGTHSSERPSLNKEKNWNKIFKYIKRRYVSCHL